MRSLSDVGRDFGLDAREVRAIAEAVGCTPMVMPTRLRLLKADEIDQIRPYLARVAESRKPRAAQSLPA